MHQRGISFDDSFPFARRVARRPIAHRPHHSRGDPGQGEHLPGLRDEKAHPSESGADDCYEVAPVSREVRFSFDTEQEKVEFSEYAAAHGMTLSAFAKWAVFAQRNRNRTGSHHLTNGRGRSSAPLDTDPISTDT